MCQTNEKQPLPILSRPRLLKQMHAVETLLLITGEPGCGKTTLLLDMAAQSLIPTCYAPLCVADRDLTHFTTHLKTTLIQTFPHLPPHQTPLTTYLQHDLVLLLDDFQHVVGAAEVESLINQLIKTSAPSCKVVIASQTTPNFAGKVLLGATYIKTADLAFPPDEIQRLFTARFDDLISETEAERLYQQTSGWITGILAFYHQGQATPLPKDLYTYFNDLFEAQPEAIQRFLLKTAPLETVDATTCHQQWGDGGWEGLIDHLLRINLFVTNLEPDWDKPPRLQYWGLFQQFLHRLRETLPALAQSQMAASAWDDAYKIYRQLDDMTGLATLIETAGLPLWRAGEQRKLLGWIETLPQALVEQSGTILALKGQIKTSLGVLGQGLDLQTQVIAKFQKEKNLEGLARSLVWRAVVYHLLDDHDAALQDAEEAIQLTDGQAGLQSIYAEACRVKGLALYYSQRASEALTWLKQAFTLYQDLAFQHDAAIVAQDIGVACANLGDSTQQVEHHFEIARTYWSEQNNAYRLAAVINDMGDFYLSRGDYLQGVAHFEQAYLLAQQTGYIRIEAFAITGLADVYTGIGEYNTAYTAYNRAEKLALKAADHFLIVYIKAAKLMLACHQQDNQAMDKASKELKCINPKTPHEHGLCALAFGYATLAQGEREEAIILLNQALQHLEPTGQVVDIDRAKTVLVWANIAQGKPYQIDEIGLRQGVIALTLANQAYLSKAIWPALKTEMKRVNDRLPLVSREMRRKETLFRGSRPQVSLQILGKAQVLVNGSALERLSPQARQILFILLNQQKGLSLLEIADLFWDYYDEGQVKWRVRRLIKELRLALGGDTILHQQKQYILNPEVEFTCDLVRYTQLLAEAEANPTDKMALWEQAADLCGRLDRDVVAHWSQAKQDDCEASMVATLMRVATRYFEQGTYAKSLHYALQAGYIDPASARVVRLAMQSYKALQEVAKIVDLFRQYTLTLQDKGLRPDDETSQLYETLIADRRIGGPTE